MKLTIDFHLKPNLTMSAAVDTKPYAVMA